MYECHVYGGLCAPGELRNGAVIDRLQDEHECQVPSKARLKRERQAYDEAEREGFGNGKHYSGNHTGAGEDIL